MANIQTPPQYSNPITFDSSNLNDEKHSWSKGYLQSFSNLFGSLSGMWSKQKQGVLINSVESELNLNVTPYFVGVSGILKQSGSIEVSGIKCSGILTATDGTSTFSIIITDGVGIIPIGALNFMISGTLNNLAGV